MLLDEKLLSMILVSVFSLSVAAWAWLMRRWVAKVDMLHRDVEAMRTQAAVRDERLTHLIGALEILRKTVSEQTGNVAILAGAVDKLWITLEAKGLIAPRPSDEVLRGVAGKRKS